MRPVALYGSECWPATKEAERHLGVMETKMLRWSSGLTQLDRIRNEDLRDCFRVVPIQDELRESRLGWYGHVLRADVDSVVKKATLHEVAGERPLGRPRQRWMDVIRNDMKMVGLHPEDAEDRIRWRHRSSKADPAVRDKR